MNLKHLILCICAVLMYARLFAQPAIKAQKTIGGSADDNFSSMALTQDGGLIAGGTSYSGISGQKTDTSRGRSDYWIIKYDKKGHRQWDKTIGGGSADDLVDIKQTSDGGYILGGTSFSDKSGEKSENNMGFPDFWIVKLDSSGNIQWDKDFGIADGSYDGSYFASLQQTSDGGYVLAGSLLDRIGTLLDFMLVKIDSLGNIQWSKITRGTSATIVQQTTDNGYILGGKTYDGVSFSDYYSVYKLDSLGDTQWFKYYEIEGASSVLNTILQTGNGYILGGYSDGYIVEGIKSEDSRGGKDYWLLAIDSIGNYVWDKTIGGSGDDYLRSMEKTSQGGIILGGYSSSNTSGEKTENNRGGGGTNDYDYWVVKLDSLRNIEWDKTIGGTNSDYLYSVKEFKPNWYVLGGYSYSGVSGDKLQHSRGGTDYWGVILDNITPALTAGKPEYTNNSIPLNNKTFTLYPNPANNKITIQSTVKAVYTLTNGEGKMIATQVIDGTGIMHLINVPVGIYYLKNNTTGITKKVAIVK